MTPTPTPPSSTPSSPAVRKSGLDVASFDSGVRVQDDLFAHVNNTWIEQHPIPQDKSRYGAFDMLREASEKNMRDIIEEAAADRGGEASTHDPSSTPQSSPADSPAAKVGDLYRSFMDTERIEQLGNSPIAEDLAAIEQLTSKHDLLLLLGHLERYGMGGLFGFYVSADAKKSDEYIVYLGQGGLGLPDEAYYREDKYAEIRAKYSEHMVRLLQLAGVTTPETVADHAYALEKELAEHHWDNVATRDAVKSYNKFSRDELIDLLGAFEFELWLEGGQLRADAFEKVVVGQPSYFEALGELFATRPLESWKAWMTWHLVTSFASYLNEALVEERFDFAGRTLSGTPQLRERWKRGVGLVEGALGEEAGKLYVERHFPPQAKERMVELVDNLVEAFRRSFRESTWMSETTQEKALDKLNKFTAKIGYPEKWRDYSDLEILADDLIGNVKRSASFETDFQLAKIGQPIDRTEWLMSPQTVNAYYHPVMNEIVFPAAILQPPFFDVEADDAVNYGGIGAVIGHELGHGFDDQGSRFNGEGELVDWWSEEDRARFDELSAKLIDQFSTYESRFAPGEKVNGGLTVGENIGDLGGLTIGFKAYQIACESNPAPELDGYTGAQRFFLGWAQVWSGAAREAEAKRLLAIDPHSPQDVRGNAARNLTEFVEAFDVQPGDGMWIDESERVRIF